MHPERNVVVVGAAGQLGQTLVRSFERRWTTTALTRRELDITNSRDVRRVLSELRPSTIVNCAAYNLVDRAEEEPEAALEANAFAVLSLARAASETGATFVHYSSDFVFDGETERPYCEDDPPRPQSVYAASKLLGEWFAAEAPDYYLLRVESLFGGAGPQNSSFDRIIDTIAAGQPMKVFTDRVVSPSYAWDIAEATAALLTARPAPGLYHCVNSGAVTWEDVAREVRRRLGSRSALEPVTLATVKLPAARPRYCALSNEKLRAAGIDMPAWDDALERHLAARNGASRE